jgi:hypothetical protein
MTSVELDPSAAFLTLDVELTWTSEPSAHDMSALILSMQAAYEIISDQTDLPPTLLRVSEIRHPNMLLTITGLAAAAIALKGWLATNPAVVVSLVNLGTNLVGKGKHTADKAAPVVVVVQQNNAELIAEVEKRLGKYNLDQEVRAEVIAALCRDRPASTNAPPVTVKSVGLANRVIHREAPRPTGESNPSIRPSAIEAEPEIGLPHAKVKLRPSPGSV